MTQEEMVSRIAKQAKLKQSDVINVLSYLVQNITDELLAGNKVHLTGLGTFEAAERAAKIGRNFRTNEPVPIPARIVPSFKPGDQLKAAVTRGKC